MQLAITPLVFVQVNMFDCGGLAIGLTFAHFIVDGISTIAFFNAWATACKAEGISEVVHPRFDLGSLFPPRENVMPGVPPMKQGDLIISQRFVFKGATISSLKAIAKCDACDFESLTKCQPSRVMVVIALIWKALIVAAKARYGNFRVSILCHSLNLRGKTALPIPPITLLGTSTWWPMLDLVETMRVRLNYMNWWMHFMI